MKLTAQEVVENGIRFLDEHYENWRERIDWDILDVSSGFRCPGGQLEGDYMEFMEKHELEIGDAARIGLTVSTTDIRWDELNAAWKEFAILHNHKAEVIKGLTGMLEDNYVVFTYRRELENAIAALRDDDKLQKIREILDA